MGAPGTQPSLPTLACCRRPPPPARRAQGAKQDTGEQAQGSLTSQALTCIPRVPAKGQLVKLVLLVHVEVIIVGLECVVVRVQEIHQQLRAQARLGGQAGDVLQAQPVVTCRSEGPTQRLLCDGPPLASSRHRCPVCPVGIKALGSWLHPCASRAAQSYLSGLRSPVCTPASTSQSPEVSSCSGLGSESQSSHRPCACHREPAERASPWQAVPGWVPASLSLSRPSSLKHLVFED